jgi:hypothetical protein
MIDTPYDLVDELLETAASQTETIARLRAIVNSLATRVAAQSAVLSLRAERAPADVAVIEAAASLAVDGMTLGPIRVGEP